jgi:UDP-N-acetylmuramyl pentapeptide phosphotransferase/UDP-N-acetylglucosamine-1-phosphate transferase
MAVGSAAWPWLIVAAAAPVSAALTWAWIGWATRRNVVDAPGQRRLHAQATPRGGGTGMGLVALLALVAFLPGEMAPVARTALVAGLAIALATGLADDLLPMSSAFKLGGQVLAAVAVAWALPWPGLAPALAFGAAGLFVLVLVNFWNFMDGSNGMVAVQSAIVAAAVAWLAPGTPLALVALATAAACMGFLPFNLPRARVFMGDAGSHALGTMIAIVLLWAMRRGDATPAQAALLLSAFGLDAGLTLAKRMLQGRRFWRAHREHLYQYAVRRGGSHARVCAAYAAWAILCSCIARVVAGAGMQAGVFAAVVVWSSGAALWVLLRRRWLKRDTRMDALA